MRSGAARRRRAGGQRHLAEYLQPPAPSTRAASVSSSGIACSAPVRDEEPVGEAEPHVDEDARHLRPGRRRRARGSSVRELLVDDAELVVEQALPRRARRGTPGSRTGCTSSARWIRRSFKSGLLRVIARNRPIANWMSTESEGVGERPDEDAEEGIADERVREDRPEVRRSRRRCASPGSSSSPAVTRTSPRRRPSTPCRSRRS